MGEIIFNGVSSKTIGLEVETFPEYVAPKRNYEKVHVPGRNGDLIFDNGSYENVVRSYEVSIGSTTEDYTKLMEKVMNWLHSTTTYARLEDSYEPDYFRLAAFLEEVTFTNLFNHAGKATLEFDCKPQRYLKSGQYGILCKKSGEESITNPTNYEAFPEISVTGSGGEGSVTLGNYPVQFSDTSKFLVVDCELQEVHYQTENRNYLATVPYGFPTIEPHRTVEVRFDGSVTQVEVKPRWYVI